MRRCRRPNARIHSTLRADLLNKRALVILKAFGLVPPTRSGDNTTKREKRHEMPKSENPKMSIQGFPFKNQEFQPENPFPEVPQSSCIFWDTQGPFLRHVYFSDVRPAGQKPTKICRNGYLFPFPWRKQPRGPCPSQRAPDLKVHSQIESFVRPNGTPVMLLLHLGQVRLSSDQAKTKQLIPKLLPFALPLKKTAPGTTSKSKSARLGGP